MTFTMLRTFIILHVFIIEFLMQWSKRVFALKRRSNWSTSSPLLFDFYFFIVLGCLDSIYSLEFSLVISEKHLLLCNLISKIYILY